MKKLTIIILLSFLACVSQAQDILEVFKNFEFKCCSGITASVKDSLTINGEFIPNKQDTLESERYSLEFTGKSFARLVMDFTTGQNGFYAVELKVIEKKDGNTLVVFSKYGGSIRMYEQHEIIVYDYINGIFTPSIEHNLPQKLSIKEYIIQATPDSILSKLEGSYSYGADLSSKDPCEVYYFADIQNPDYYMWLDRERIAYRWTGNKFEKFKLD